MKNKGFFIKKFKFIFLLTNRGESCIILIRSDVPDNRSVKCNTVGGFFKMERRGNLMQFRPDIKVVDATIRDGGLVNNFFFDDEFRKFDTFRNNEYPKNTIIARIAQNFFVKF